MPPTRRSFLVRGGTLLTVAAASRAGGFFDALAAQGGAGASDKAAIDALVADLVAANRVLAIEGVLDGMGHVSVRRPGRTDRFFLARSIAPELVTAGDVLEYDLEGQALDANGRASYQERFIHSEIYRVRPDVQA